VAKQLVFVEIRESKIYRILRTNADAWRLPSETVQQWPRAEAVKTIRQQVFERSKGECEDCGKRITWDNGELNEIVPKSSGGEVSMENCNFICHACHQGRADSYHGDRRWGGRQ